MANCIRNGQPIAYFKQGRLASSFRDAEGEPREQQDRLSNGDTTAA
jgi:hypothetical protein